MPTIKLIPSVLNNAAGTTYLSVEDQDNMFTDTSSTTYGTIYNMYQSTSNRYVYLKGFDFSSVPSNAVVSSWTVRIKGYYTSGYSSTMYLCNNTTTQSNAIATSLNSSVNTREFSNGSLTWDQIKAFGTNGADFGIRINCRRGNQNTPAAYCIYGAEIEVTYTIPVARTITTTLTGNGTIDPTGTNTYYDGDTFNLEIHPSYTESAITVTKNGTDVTSSLVVHRTETTSAVLGTYSLKSGGFNGSGASYFQGLVGKGHTATGTTSNYYSSGSNTQAVFQYEIHLNVPANATITRLYMMATGHAESTTQSSEYMCVRLKSGNTNLSEQYNFKSAGQSNTTQTIEATTLPTHEQLSSLVVECTLGYYGGALSGVTVFCEYTSDMYYTYTYTIDSDATIAVVIGGAQQTLYYKNNGSWVAVTTAYKKVNGSWVQQTNLSNVFDANTNYVKGN